MTRHRPHHSGATNSHQHDAEGAVAWLKATAMTPHAFRGAVTWLGHNMQGCAAGSINAILAARPSRRGDFGGSSTQPTGGWGQISGKNEVGRGGANIWWTIFLKIFSGLFRVSDKRITDNEHCFDFCSRCRFSVIHYPVIGTWQGVRLSHLTPHGAQSKDYALFRLHSRTASLLWTLEDRKSKGRLRNSMPGNIIIGPFSQRLQPKLS